MIIALSSTRATIGLVVVFFVVFPILAQGLIAFAIAQVLGERSENQAYEAGHRPRPHE
jgi:NADH:ubiquinone oxidoreductase subunit 3 (subunit A)